MRNRRAIEIAPTKYTKSTSVDSYSALGSPMTAPWHITLFGGLSLQRGEQTITRFKYQKVGGLLAYLTYHPQQMHAREMLVDMFWPDSGV